jgi:hypothetical protein
MENLFEKLAYISVGLDFVVALASFLVIKDAPYSKFMLTVGSELILLEMIVIVAVFITIFSLKHYGKMLQKFTLLAFRERQIRKQFGRRIRATFAKSFLFEKSKSAL